MIWICHATSCNVQNELSGHSKQGKIHVTYILWVSKWACRWDGYGWLNALSMFLTVTSVWLYFLCSSSEFESHLVVIHNPLRPLWVILSLLHFPKVLWCLEMVSTEVSYHFLASEACSEVPMLIQGLHSELSRLRINVCWESIYAWYVTLFTPHQVYILDKIAYIFLRSYTSQLFGLGTSVSHPSPLFHVFCNINHLLALPRCEGVLSPLPLDLLLLHGIRPQLLLLSQLFIPLKHLWAQAFAGKDGRKRWQSGWCTSWVALVCQWGRGTRGWGPCACCLQCSCIVWMCRWTLRINWHLECEWGRSD